jgi:hypothetical protein
METIGTTKLSIVYDKPSCDFTGYDADILMKETAKLRKLITKKGTLGPKLYFLRLPKSEKKTEDEYTAKINSDFEEKVKGIEKALFEYLKWFEMRPEEKNNTANLPKITWNTSKDDVDAKRYVVRLARLLAYLRGLVPTWHTRITQGSNYGYGMAIKEECDRAITQLYNLARGHALSRGRNYVTLDDIPLIIKVVLSTASK